LLIEDNITDGDVFQDGQAIVKEIERCVACKRRDAYLVESYVRLGMNAKAARVYDCGTQLAFEVFTDGTVKLHGANFCKVRLCSMCAKRRSLKIFAQVSKIMDHVQANHNYRFIFLTLTQENVRGNDLSKELDRIFSAFNKMTELKAFKAVSKGFFRSLEVTHKKRDDYHPHIHMVIAVNPSYFKDKTYISHAKWMDMWRICMGLEYDPWVRVKVVRSHPDIKEREETVEMGKAIAEIAKYTVKPEQYLVLVNKERTDEAVLVLDAALANRRLFAFGGKFREIHKNLNLDNPIDGKLTEDDTIRPDLARVIVRYDWNVGASNYVRRAPSAEE
jgi:plasmid rolling circle replication initiator protein Rep